MPPQRKERESGSFAKLHACERELRRQKRGREAAERENERLKRTIAVLEKKIKDLEAEIEYLTTKHAVRSIDTSCRIIF
jgi:cell division protein FtsB